MRRHLRLLSGIALVAVLALALLPTLSHARAHARSQGPGGWAEVCTQQGPQRVALDADGRLMDTVIADEGTVSASHLQHCPLCVLSLDAPLLPPAAPEVLPGMSAVAAMPAAFLHAPRTLHAWRSAQPRGPPATA